MVSIMRKRPRLDIPTTSWFDLPFEMREMVIDRMDAKTRCKFTQCSKLCEKEVKESKNYVKGIKIKRRYHPELVIGHDKFHFSYCLEFMDVADLTEKQCIVVYKTVPKRFNWDRKPATCVIKWMKTETGEADDVRMRYLEDYLEKYQKTITTFEIDDHTFPISRHNMKKLRKLENIEDRTGKDLLNYDFFDLSQISHANVVDMETTNFTFDEILNFEGSFYIIKSDDLDEENIIKYLKMLKDGEFNRNMKYLSVCIKDRSVNGRKVSKGLDVFNYVSCDRECYFRFLLNYERKRKCFVEVTYSISNLRVQVESIGYDEVIKNRK